jgi:tRNA (guanine37-N1)-methyltransferase
MRISILTLFPEMFAGPFDHSMLRRAQEKNLLEINVVNIRDFAQDAYRSVDDRPFGGGAGMILRVDVVDRALKHVTHQASRKPTRTILLDPQGTPYTQKKAATLANYDHLVLVCGHYEGVDARIRSLVDEEVSVGDYILTGGELAAMIIADSVVRLIPGVLGNKDATRDESFSDSHLEYPQYTQPRNYKGAKVPDVLLGGNHALIEAWRKKMSRNRTQEQRPDLLKKSSTGKTGPV